MSNKLFSFCLFNFLISCSPFTRIIDDYEDYHKKEIDLTGRGVVISELENEKMTQCPSVFFCEGKVYIIYYTNPDYKVESPISSTFCKLAIIDLSNQLDIRYVNVLKSGDVVGTFKVGPYATYDPQVIVIGDSIYCFVIAVDADDKENRGYVCRKINKQTLETEDRIEKLTFTYDNGGESVTVPMYEQELSQYVDMRMGRQNGVSYFGRPALCQLKKNGDYYYTYLGGLVYGSSAGRGYPGTLIRSNDGIHWEEVVCPTFLYNKFGISDIHEAALEIQNNLVYLYFRTSQAPMISYNLDSNIWSIPFFTFNGNYQGARNFLFNGNDSIYAFANCYPEVENSYWGAIMRSRLRVFKYDYSLSLLDSMDLTSEYGLVYPVVFYSN